MPKKYIETGKIVGTHGVRGEMRVQAWCDTPEIFTGYKLLYLDENGASSLKVLSSRVHGNVCLIKVSDVDTIEKAEALRGKVLYIDRKDIKLQKGQYLIDDIVGCKVYDAETDMFYGTISEVSQTGANDVWHIMNEGKEYLLPNIPEFIKVVDIENSVVLVTPIRGVFDDED